MSDAKQHVVCVPFPFQSHLKGMLILAKLLHHHGFHVTYVNTDFNRDRILRSHGPAALDGAAGFRFESIPDALPPSDPDTTQDFITIVRATRTTFLAPFRQLLTRLAAEAQSSKLAPPVTCIVSDGFLPFTYAAGMEFRLPVVAFWTVGACTLLCGLQYRPLMEKGYVPLRESSYLTNGYLDTVVEWIPGMKNMRLRDLCGFIRTTDPNDTMFSAMMFAVESGAKASANIVNTFSELEPDALEALKGALPRLYPIGPIHLLLNQLQVRPENPTQFFDLNFWKEEPECLRWLDSKAPNSVVYVNFGSITVLTAEQLMEFAWGLANSQRDFLWVIRRDLAPGESVVFSPEFEAATRGRTCMVGWCPQEEVLLHPAVGGFLTHCGWNSMVESMAAGVPMICWPFFGDQPTNCRYCCVEWGVGMEIGEDVRRERVERMVRELMDGEMGRKLKSRVTEWKCLAEAAGAPNGSSSLNLDELIKKVSCLPI